MSAAAIAAIALALQNSPPPLVRGILESPICRQQTAPNTCALAVYQAVVISCPIGDPTRQTCRTRNAQGTYDRKPWLRAISPVFLRGLDLNQWSTRMIILPTLVSAP